MKNSRLATAFITATAISGLAMLGGSVLKMTALHHYQFLSLLVLGAVTSRTKVKLPGIDGTMSVNLPFMMIAAAQLSLFEAVVVALVSATLQSIPKRGGQFQAVKMLFNASTIVLASGIAALVLHSDKLMAMHHSGSVAMAAACGMFFVVNTLPVATIIAITEGSGMMRIWSSIAHLSFPLLCGLHGRDLHGHPGQPARWMAGAVGGSSGDVADVPVVPNALRESRSTNRARSVASGCR